MSITALRPVVGLLSALLLIPAGCEHKEKVLDIKAPGVRIEVDKTSSGKEVHVMRKKTLEDKPVPELGGTK